MAQPTNLFEWMVFLFQEYGEMFWQGTLVTLYIAIAGTIIGFVLGFVLGVLSDLQVSPHDPWYRRLPVWILKWIGDIYIEIFRDTPMIVQAMVIYYGLRSAGIEITPVPAAILVTVLNTGAYMSETVRAGINSVDPGQREGGLALGMTTMKIMVKVILPGFAEHHPGNGEYVPDKPENDVCTECHRRDGAVHGGQNHRCGVLQIL